MVPVPARQPAGSPGGIGGQFAPGELADQTTLIEELKLEGFEPPEDDKNHIVKPPREKATYGQKLGRWAVGLTGGSIAASIGLTFAYGNIGFIFLSFPMILIGQQMAAAADHHTSMEHYRASIGTRNGY